MFSRRTKEAIVGLKDAGSVAQEALIGIADGRLVWISLERPNVFIF
jgi:hypothetical protein